MDSVIREAIRDRILAAVPTAQVSLYLPLSADADGAPVLAPVADQSAVRSAVIDRLRVRLTCDHSGMTTGEAVYRVVYAESVKGVQAHSEFHERLDDVFRRLLFPARFGLDDADPRTNVLRRVEALEAEIQLGAAATGSARVHYLTAQIDLTLSLYWRVS